MKYRELQHVKESSVEYEEIERIILALFRDEIYLPLLKILGEPKSTLQNATSDLIGAILSGKIVYSDGHFRGQFNSAVSRELKRIGAEWDRKQGSWKVSLRSLSTDVRSAIDAAQTKFKKAAERLEKHLKNILPEEIAGKLKTEKVFDTTLRRTDGSIQKTVQSITVLPTLTKEARAKLADGYTKDLQRYIADWSKSEILRLRKEVQASVLKGIRYENMVAHIQKSYEVSENKAKFLARQETNLMVSKFKEIRYADAGINQYKWCCVAGSKSHPVRPTHKALEGKIFSWDNPPITNDKGGRNNPGQDFGCRCFARPIVKF